jgi:hypothetical protein
MPTSILCQYNLIVSGNQSQASLAARLAAVPLDLSLPRMWGLIPTSDVTSTPSATIVERVIELNMGNTFSAPITAVQDSSPLHGRVRSLILGSTTGYLAGPPIVNFSAPNPSGLKAAASPVMGLKQVLIANGGLGYTGATTAALVGGNLAPGGTPATLGAITLIGGSVTSVAVANPGSGYTTYPQIVFTDSGGGSGASAYGGLNLVGVTLNSGGSLYSAPPTVTLTSLFFASTPGEVGGEVTDYTMGNWMTGQMQIGTRSPIQAFSPGIV